LIEAEVFGAGLLEDGVTVAEVRRLCLLAADSRGVRDGHLAVEFVAPERICELNREHREKSEPTDVLAFPIDGIGSSSQPPAPRELGDVLICPAHTSDLRAAVVHGVLHLCGMDHERDQGQMLALQAELLRSQKA
jgi:probable rRNA maturation factor